MLLWCTVPEIKVNKEELVEVISSPLHGPVKVDRTVLQLLSQGHKTGHRSLVPMARQGPLRQALNSLMFTRHPLEAGLAVLVQDHPLLVVTGSNRDQR